MVFKDDLDYDSYADLFYEPTQFNSFHTPSNTMRVIPPMSDAELYRHPLQCEGRSQWMDTHARAIVDSTTERPKIPAPVLRSPDTQLWQTPDAQGGSNGATYGYVLLAIIVLFLCLTIVKRNKR